ncbi:hypothetical protein ACZ90_42750 [Streptomyces albus subsp. albus]|nr:hypothetical protein ACZ90_42750 [Streptomyces albus subsp. albus]
MSETNPAQRLADRSIAVWNVSDPERRRAAVHELWAEHGTHALQPPRDMRTQARRLGIREPVLEARGRDAVEFRVTRSYEEFVATGGFVFRSADDARQLRNVVTFRWHSVLAARDEVSGGGLAVLVLDEEGRIETDHLFVD